MKIINNQTPILPIRIADVIIKDMFGTDVVAANIADIKKQADSAHKVGKRLFIHLDLAVGIGKDEYGIAFAKEQGDLFKPQKRSWMQ